jgi:glutathione S-transferase
MPEIQHPPAQITLYSCQYQDRFGAMHACSRAHRALEDAGIVHDFSVFGKGRPLGIGTTGTRPELKRISGQEKLPVLALTDGTTISGSGPIAAWAKEHAAGG